MVRIILLFTYTITLLVLLGIGYFLYNNIIGSTSLIPITFNEKSEGEEKENVEKPKIFSLKMEDIKSNFSQKLYQGIKESDRKFLAYMYYSNFELKEIIESKDKKRLEDFQIYLGEFNDSADWQNAGLYFTHDALFDQYKFFLSQGVSNIDGSIIGWDLSNEKKTSEVLNTISNKYQKALDTYDFSDQSIDDKKTSFVIPFDIKLGLLFKEGIFLLVIYFVFIFILKIGRALRFIKYDSTYGDFELQSVLKDANKDIFTPLYSLLKNTSNKSLWEFYHTTIPLPENMNCKQGMKMCEVLERQYGDDKDILSLKIMFAIQIAWKVRGDGTVDTIGEKRYKKFLVKLSDAWKMCRQLEEKFPNCHFSYAHKIRLGTILKKVDDSQAVDYILNLSKKAEDLFPDNYYGHSEALDLVKSKWFGYNDEMYKITEEWFLNGASNRLIGGFLLEAYYEEMIAMNIDEREGFLASGHLEKKVLESYKKNIGDITQYELSGYSYRILELHVLMLYLIGEKDYIKILLPYLPIEYTKERFSLYDECNLYPEGHTYNQMKKFATL